MRETREKQRSKMSERKKEREREAGSEKRRRVVSFALEIEL